MIEKTYITWEEIKKLAGNQGIVAAVDETTKTLYIYKPIVFNEMISFNNTDDIGFSIYKI